MFNILLQIQCVVLKKIKSKFEFLIDYKNLKKNDVLE